MKKLLVLVAVTLMTFGLSACTTTSIDLEQILAEGTMTSEESIATLSYLSVGFLDFESTDPVVKDTSLIQLAVTTETEEDSTVIEEELDELNIYLDRLKGFIANGVDSFGSVTDVVSDNELYAYKMQFTVNEEEYVIYYNVDEITLEMTGIIIIGESEYEFEVVDNIHNYEHHQELNKEQNEEKNNNDDDDDDVEDDDTEANNEESENNEEQNQESNNDEDDDEYEENETKMVLIATNGEDTIKIMYMNEVEEDEVTTKFYMVKTIAGVTSEVSMKISQEEDEYKVDIEEDGNSFTFKQETEDEGTVYKLQYEVDGTKGQVKIFETIDEEGNITYEYQIQEAGRNKNVEKQEPQSKGLDDDEDEEDDDDDENGNGNKQDNTTNQNNEA